MEFCFTTFAWSMKKTLFLLLLSFILVIIGIPALGQCSICTRTAEQLGDEPARGLNAGILYLALTPFAIVGVIGYRWWKRNRDMA